MIEVQHGENSSDQKRSYPFLVKSKGSGFLVIATGDGEGFALGGSCAFDCSHGAVSGWCDWNNEDDWEILPAGTTITLKVK